LEREPKARPHGKCSSDPASWKLGVLRL